MIDRNRQLLETRGPARGRTPDTKVIPSRSLSSTLLVDDHGALDLALLHEVEGVVQVLQR
jgi:hypothetical protein